MYDVYDVLRWQSHLHPQVAADRDAVSSHLVTMLMSVKVNFIRIQCIPP